MFSLSSHRLRCLFFGLFSYIWKHYHYIFVDIFVDHSRNSYILNILNSFDHQSDQYKYKRFLGLPLTSFGQKNMWTIPVDSENFIKLGKMDAAINLNSNYQENLRLLYILTTNKRAGVYLDQTHIPSKTQSL